MVVLFTIKFVLLITTVVVPFNLFNLNKKPFNSNVLIEVNVMNTLGKRLKSARKRKGLKQKELESISGVSQQLISKIEREQIENTHESFTLAEALGVDPKWLATGLGEMEFKKVLPNQLSEQEKKLVELFRNLTSEQKNDTLCDVEKIKHQNEVVLKELQVLMG